MNEMIDSVELNESRLQMLEKEFDRAPAYVRSPIYDTERCPALFVQTDEIEYEPEPFPLELEAPIDSYVSEDELPANPFQDEEPSIEAAPESVQIVAPTFYTYGGRRYDLICTGVCVSCAHCGMDLTDAVSVERGLGPTCSKRGYLEDPVNSDEMQALIDLAEYPELVDFLVAKYKPLGVRGLMNGLVKIASLNRRASGLHAAICDAIESLGYKRLASTLRDSIAIIEIKVSKIDPTCYNVWVKRSEWNWNWTDGLKAICGINRYAKLRSGEVKGVLIPQRHKKELWELMLKQYEGFAAKTPAGTIKISRKSIDSSAT